MQLILLSLIAKVFVYFHQWVGGSLIQVLQELEFYGKVYILKTSESYRHKVLGYQVKLHYSDKVNEIEVESTQWVIYLRSLLYLHLISFLLHSYERVFVHHSINQYSAKLV